MQSPLLSTYFRLPVPIVRGEGAYLFDAEGKRILDFAAGIAVAGLGHCHPHLVAAITEQAKVLWHCSNLVTIPEQIRLANRLLAHAPGLDTVFFCSSGLEAVETAIKLARRFHYQRSGVRGQGLESKKSPIPDPRPLTPYRIITLQGGFHGRSIACLSAGGNAAAREGFGPLLEGFDPVPAGDIAAMQQAVTPQTGAILLEPVQAEGGVHVLDHAYLRAVRALADRHGLLLVLDEVQCGYGRTGTFFAYEQAGICPDILTTAKGIGNGFPLAACLMTEAVASPITPGLHGSTYGGNPLAMAVGNAVLDVMEAPGFLTQVQQMGALLKDGLEKLRQRFPKHIRAVRGVGLLLGLELTLSAKTLLLRAAENGLLVTRAGEDNVLRLVPPLIITSQHIEEALAILEKTFARVDA